MFDALRRFSSYASSWTATTIEQNNVETVEQKAVEATLTLPDSLSNLDFRPVVTRLKQVPNIPFSNRQKIAWYKFTCDDFRIQPASDYKDRTLDNKIAIKINENGIINSVSIVEKEVYEIPDWAVSNILELRQHIDNELLTSKITQTKNNTIPANNNNDNNVSTKLNTFKKENTDLLNPQIQHIDEKLKSLTLKVITEKNSTTSVRNNNNNVDTKLKTAKEENAEISNSQIPIQMRLSRPIAPETVIEMRNNSNSSESAPATMDTKLQMIRIASSSLEGVENPSQTQLECLFNAQLEILKNPINLNRDLPESIISVGLNDKPLFKILIEVWGKKQIIVGGRGLRGADIIHLVRETNLLDLVHFTDYKPCGSFPIELISYEQIELDDEIPKKFDGIRLFMAVSES